MARPDLIGLAVLGLLTEHARHPYEMHRLMHERHKDFASGKGRTFYDAVERLQRQGLIEPVETTRAGNRPERTVYRITEEGVPSSTAGSATSWRRPRQIILCSRRPSASSGTWSRPMR
jgi:DNA-binding PadR family transcriptional regulator